MSLFRYKVLLDDGKEKTSKITAKTKEAAQARVAKLHAVKEWRWIKEEKIPVSAVPEVKSVLPPKSVAAAKPAASKATKLEKLLYLQSNKCFFCGRVLTKAEASVEHLLPKSKGGSNDDGNVVVCCVTLNRTFGGMDLKEKVRIILEKAGDFTCPKV